MSIKNDDIITSENDFKKVRRIDFNKYKNLPFPVFITRADDESGEFLEMNQEAMTLFLPNGKKQNGKKYYIINYYKYKIDRRFVLENLNKVLQSNFQNNKLEWETKKTLEFSINNRKQNLRFYAKPYGDIKGKLLGCICVAFSIPEIDKFHIFENEISNGVFELGWELKLIYSNRRFNELLKLNHFNSEISFADLFMNYDDFKTMINEIEEFPHKEIYKFDSVVFKTIDGYPILGNLVIQPQYGEYGDLIKARAIFRELTNHEIVEKAPIGIYLVMKDKNDNVIVKANKQFLQIHEFEDESECIGFPIKNLHLTPESLAAFEEKLKTAHRNGKMLENYEFKIKTIKGNIKTLRVNAQIIEDPKTHSDIGRIGIVFDVNNAIDEVRRELQQDFEDFLHSYYHQLLNIQGSILSVVAGHGTDVVKNQIIDMDRSLKLMNNHIKKLESDWLILVKEIKAKRIDFDISKIELQLNSLDKKQSKKLEERANWVRLAMIEIRSQLNFLKKNYPIHKVEVKTALNDIVEILRYARLISLGVLINEIKPFLSDIDKFKNDVFKDREDSPVIEKVNVFKTVDEAIVSLQEFSTTRNVTIETDYRGKFDSCFIEADEREFYRAVYNILHNAIKYSRNELKIKNGYVQINISQTRDEIRVEMKNLGVPIRKTELERKLIYNFRVRGASALEDRQGSGIGLWSVKKFVDKYGASIDITSSPTGFNKADDYTKWFRTIVTLKLKKTNYE